MDYPNMRASIIIPCHNHRKELESCLRSIKRQTVTFDVEIIVVDDSSKDHPEDIAEQYGARYIRVNAKNANSARNAGLAAATGEIIVWLDADNELLAGGLSSLVTPILTGQADATYGRSHLFGDTKYYPYTAYNQRQCGLEDLKIGNSIDTMSAVRRAVLPVKPWDEHLLRHQDWDYHLRNMRHGVRYLFVDTPVFAYRISTYQGDRPYRSGQLYQYARQYIRHKYELESASRAEITIGLPSIGRYYCAEQWLAAAEALDYPKERCNLHILDNSSDAHFFHHYILPFVKRHEHKFNAVYIRVKHTGRFLGGNNSIVQENEQGRLQKFPVMMQHFSDHLTTEYLFILEDDTTCEPSALTQLKRGLDADPLAVAIQGVERSRVTKYALGAWVFDTQKRHINLYTATVDSGVVKIGAGGFYCLLVKNEWCTRYQFQTRHLTDDPEVYGACDIAHGWDIMRAGKHFLMDWGVRCVHWGHTDTGAVYPLSLDTGYNEPPEIFAFQHYEGNRYVLPQELPLPDQPPIINTLPDRSFTETIFGQKTAAPSNEYPLTIYQKSLIPPQRECDLIIYGLTDPEQVDAIREALSGLPFTITNLTLIPQDKDGYRLLRDSHQPANTVLKPAHAPHQQLTWALQATVRTTIVVWASTLIDPRMWLDLMAVDDSLVPLVGSISGSFNHQTMEWRLTTERQPEYPVHISPVISAELLLMRPEVARSLTAAPDLTQHPYILGFYLSTQLWHSPYPITTSDRLQNEPALPITPRFMYDLGLLAGKTIPFRKIPRFARHNCPTNRRQFYRGLWVDILARLRQKPRH